MHVSNVVVSPGHRLQPGSFDTSCAEREVILTKSVRARARTNSFLQRLVVISTCSAVAEIIVRRYYGVPGAAANTSLKHHFAMVVLVA